MNKYSFTASDIYTDNKAVKVFYGPICKTEGWKNFFYVEKIIPFPMVRWAVQRGPCLLDLEWATNLPTVLYRRQSLGFVL